MSIKMPKKAQRKKDLKEQKTSVTQSHFNCPVCLDLLRDPVTVPCGHSFCSGCLQGCWDQDENTGTYRCPQCRQTFSTRPNLGKNIMLAEMVEKMREENEGDEGTSHCYAEPGDEECSVCIGRKRKATMSCLECLNSYCESHFRSHEELFLIKKHKTINATEPLKEKICGRHKKLVDVFCCKDQQCVCYECALESHRGHETISASMERAERQKQTNVAITQSIQEKENEVQEVRKAMDSLRLSAQALIEQNRSDFTTFTNSIMKWCCDLEKCVREQESHQLSHARTQLSYLDTEIRGLKRRRAELEQLSHTEDDVHFLKNFPSLYHPPEQSLWTCDEEQGARAINGLDWGGLEKQVVNFCKEQLDKVTHVRRVTLEGLTREDFIQYSKRLSLDPDTAYRHFYLSEDNTKLSWSNRCEQNGGDLKRFLHCRQVLCEQRLYGRCYWEVEWSTRYETSMAVSYIDIDRKDTGDKNRFGRNDQSWSLDCSDMKYEVRHNEIVIKIQRRPSSKRVAVYVDVGAGNLAFYEVSKTGILTTLHKHKTTFTKPLYAGFFGDAYTYLTLCPL